MPGTELKGLTILVTRPEHQADSLCHLIENAGGQALRLPALTILDNSDNPATRQTLQQLADYDLAIFISPNAVRFALAAINQFAELPPQLKLAAVGKGSAHTIKSLTGREADLVPSERFDSEGLLALDELQQMGGKRVVIFRGNGGRELLAETLHQRGAEVDYAEVYRRECPPALDDGDDRITKADIIVVTSSEGLGNLVTITPASQREKLLNTSLLLVSERATKVAYQLGFKGDCLVSAKAADSAIIETLKAWQQQRSINTTDHNNE